MAKQQQIVCQHLERVSRRVLSEYRDIIAAYIKGRHGIYALYRGDKLHYVGLATSLMGRLKQHLRDKHAKSWTHFSVYLTIQTGHVKELESLLLRIVNPEGNSQSGKFARSENLSRKLKADIKAEQQAALGDLIGSRVAPQKKKRTKKVKPATGKRLMLADCISSPLPIRCTYKGKIYRARARRDGQIRYDKELYASPSAAGKAVVGHNVDGWHFWKYQRAPGDWVQIDELRK